MTTPIPVSQRFFAPEISKVIFVPEIADAGLAYTRVELDAGTDLTDEIFSIEGFNVTTAEVQTPDWGSRFVTSVPGRKTPDASRIVFYASRDGQDVRTVLTEGLTGNLVFADGGLVDGDPSDVYAVEVSNVSKVRSDQNALQLTVSFTIRRPLPNIDFPIPAEA